MRSRSAAADNLVPVTLELGGKCPAILAADSVDAESVRSVIGTKLIKNGQMCISVDYALVPRAQVDEFVAHAEVTRKPSCRAIRVVRDCTGIITRGTWSGSRRWSMKPGSPARAWSRSAAKPTRPRRLPLALVVDPPRDLRIMQEEVFGPILPVIPYDDLTRR